MNIKNRLSEPDRLKMLKYAKKGKSWIFSIFRLVILMSIGYIVIYPLFYMLVTSLIDRDAYTASVRVWIPTSFNVIDNYIKAFQVFEYKDTILNTLKMPVLSAGIEVCSCAIVAYGFARFEFKFKKLLMAFLFLTILVPDMMLLIPRVVNFANLDFLGIFGLLNRLTGVDLRLHIYNTEWTFWLPSLFGVGLRSGILIFIYMQFFKGLPRELEEAAWVDGAGPIKTFLRIAVPSSSVVFLTTSVFSLIWHYNDSLLSSMYLTKKYPIAVRLSNFTTEIFQRHNIEFNPGNPGSVAIAMAACLIYVAPVLIIYMILQRGFIESIDRVGITG